MSLIQDFVQTQIECKTNKFITDALAQAGGVWSEIDVLSVAHHDIEHVVPVT